jgi:hypothetical protein
VFVRGALGYDRAMLQDVDAEPSVMAARSREAGAG